MHVTLTDIPCLVSGMGVVCGVDVCLILRFMFLGLSFVMSLTQ